MEHLSEINRIFNSIINYETINKDGICVRNYKNGISLQHAIYYSFLYSKLGATKEAVVSKINSAHGTTFTRPKVGFARQAFDSKNKNIPLSTFTQLHSMILKLANNVCKESENNKILLAVDGTNNRDNKQKIMLNLGYYNVTNDIPICIDVHGAENRNKEVGTLIDTIIKYPDRFENVIIVGDRGYFSYKLMIFLIDHKIDFIIRARGVAAKLDVSNKLAKNTSGYETIKRLREHVRVAKYVNEIDKDVYATTGKNIKARKHLVKLKNDCVLVTSLSDKVQFPKNRLMEMYRSRWDIETFFGFIKNNCKLQNMQIDYDYDAYQKMCILEMIMAIIIKIIAKSYSPNTVGTIKKQNGQIVECTIKVNKTNMATGFYEYLIYDIIHGNLKKDKLNTYCKNYIKIVKNATGRSFPRTAKTPFCKWYVKGYSIVSQMSKLLSAVLSGNIDKLNKNLKMIAKRITSVDGKIIKNG